MNELLGSLVAAVGESHVLTDDVDMAPPSHGLAGTYNRLGPRGREARQYLPKWRPLSGVCGCKRGDGPAGRQYRPVRRRNAVWPRRLGRHQFVASEPHPSIDPLNDTIVVEAGCTLGALQEAAAGAESPFPALACVRRELRSRRQPLDECRRRSCAALREHARPGARARSRFCPTDASGTDWGLAQGQHGLRPEGSSL